MEDWRWRLGARHGERIGSIKNPVAEGVRNASVGGAGGR